MNTTKYQKNQPEPISRDSRGILIEPGLRVAFNRSGNILIGKIVSVDKNKWKKIRDGLNDNVWWNLEFQMIIEHENSDLKTIVKNPNSFIIIG